MLAVIGVVIQTARMKRDILVHRGHRAEIGCCLTKSSPMQIPELVKVCNTTDEPEFFHFGQAIATKWSARCPNPFIAPLVRKEYASSWGRLNKTRTHWDSSASESYGTFAPTFRGRSQRFIVSFKESYWDNLECWTMPKILDAIVGYHSQMWWYKLKSIYLDWTIQSQPRTLAIYARFPLYASLPLHFAPHPVSYPSIDSDGNEGSGGHQT